MSVSSGKLFARACIPPGMDQALEGLAREVLKEQPRDIYLFAARHFQKLVQIRDQEKNGTKVVVGKKPSAKAHSAGLSPSSTQASDNAGLIPDTPTEAAKQVAEDVVITSQDAVREISLDTNGAAKTGVGLGPGVAALAASTGTVAILGATADTTLDNVEGVKQVAAEVVNEVKEAAEEAVKDGKKGVEDVSREAEVVVEKATGGLIKSPSGGDNKSPELKEVASVTTSPVLQENFKVASVPTSPLVEDIKSESAKERSTPISPTTEALIESKEASVVTSPITEIGGKLSSAVTSPISDIGGKLATAVTSSVPVIGSKIVSAITSPTSQTEIKEASLFSSPIPQSESKVDSAVTSPISDIGGKLANAVTSSVPEVGSKIASAFTSPTPQGDSKVDSAVTSPISDIGGKLATAVTSSVPVIGSKIASAFSSPTPPAEIKEASLFSSPIPQTESKVDSAVTSPISDIGSKLANAVTSSVPEIGNKISSAFSSPTPQAEVKEASLFSSPIPEADSKVDSAVTSPISDIGGKLASAVTSSVPVIGSKIASAFSSPTPPAEIKEASLFSSPIPQTESKVDSVVTSPILPTESKLGSAFNSSISQIESKVDGAVTSTISQIGSKLDSVLSSPTPPVESAVVSPVTSPIPPVESARASAFTTPIPEIGGKIASVVTSPIPPVGSKEASAVTSPILQFNKEEATLSLSSLPEDSIPSSIKDDVLPTSSSSAIDEIGGILSNSAKSIAQSPSVEKVVSDGVQIAAQIQEKTASRPTSGALVDFGGKHVVGVVDGTLPEPPSSEILNTTAVNIKQEVTDVVGKVKSSIEQEINAPNLGSGEVLPNTAAGIDSKIDDIKGSLGGVAGVALSQFSTTVGSVQEAISPTAVVEKAAEKASSVMSLAPHIEVSAPSRPQSAEVSLFSATTPKAEISETIIEADNAAKQEQEKPETQEMVESVKEKLDETEGARPTSAQVEEKAEEVVNEVVQTVTSMVTSAATTIQATFRGHQTRQNLRKIADQEELTDAISSDLDKDADVTLSLDAKSSDTKEESSETVEDSFPPPLHDGDSELLSTSTEKEELQPVVNVTISAEPVDSRSESVVESEKASERTLPSESEQGSLEGLVEDLPRAASVVSESTVSIGDSISAVKGSETDSILSANEETGGDLDGKKGAAATTIQASFRGFQTRQNLQKIVDDTQLPVPEPLQNLPFEDVADEDDLPPPPEEYDIEPPPPVEGAVVETPRSPETGEKLKKSVEQVSYGPTASEWKRGFKDQGRDGEMTKEEAAKLALLQRPQQCDELPEHRGEVAVALQSVDIATEPEAKGDPVNGVLNADASSAEVDDSSLSSAATKIQAGARGYLTRKLMKDTFSTTAPSITDSQSVGATLTSDDGFHTSGSLETEVQRQTSADEQNIGVTAVVIANVADKSAKSVGNGLAGLHEEILSYSKSLDSQFPHEKKKAVLATAGSENNAKDAVEDKQVWQTLQGEMEEAATKIQSNFRGYRTRQRLHRENAVQVTTSSGTPGTTSESSDAPPMPPATATAAAATTIRSSGEFHDMMVLTPDPPASDVKSDSWDGVGVGVGVDDDALARSQASELGTRLEGHVIPVATPATDAVSAMGKARETTSPKESSVKEMKGARAKAAATKIQAGFRGYKVRKQMKQLQEKKSGPRRRSSVQSAQIVREKMTLQDKSATTIQAGVRGFLVRKRRLEEKNAAVKIQAGFRGYKVRRDVKTRAPVEK